VINIIANTLHNNNSSSNSCSGGGGGGDGGGGGGGGGRCGCGAAFPFSKALRFECFVSTLEF